MKVKELDHFVLTVKNIRETCHFYTTVLGMEVITFAKDRTALKFGNQKINLHENGNEFEPKALNPTPGSADLCFITDTPIIEIEQNFRNLGIPIVEGPVNQIGAKGDMNSIYVRDPDGNLIEVSNYMEKGAVQKV